MQCTVDCKRDTSKFNDFDWIFPFNTKAYLENTFTAAKFINKIKTIFTSSTVFLNELIMHEMI